VHEFVEDVLDDVSVRAEGSGTVDRNREQHFKRGIDLATLGQLARGLDLKSARIR
jgi:hypothetical protein